MHADGLQPGRIGLSEQPQAGPGLLGNPLRQRHQVGGLRMLGGGQAQQDGLLVSIDQAGGDGLGLLAGLHGQRGRRALEGCDRRSHLGELLQPARGAAVSD
jgi:hypothetical protein